VPIQPAFWRIAAAPPGGRPPQPDPSSYLEHLSEFKGFDGQLNLIQFKPTNGQRTLYAQGADSGFEKARKTV
jgi:hypothetical protein